MNFSGRLNSLKSTILENFRSVSEEFWTDISNRAKIILQETQNISSEEDANKAWFLKVVSEERARHINSFNLMKEAKYYEAWCELEKTEIALPWLLKNKFFDPDIFETAKLLEQVKRIQTLFPYKVFFSPSIKVLEKLCSICESKIDPWNRCTHKKQNVYMGIECVAKITKAEIRSISVVFDPVQKYSVVRTDPDNLNYSLVKFWAEHISSPFEDWNLTWQTDYTPSGHFPDLKLLDACPCGSGRIYKNCCSTNPGIRHPHAQFEFQKP